VKGNSQGEIQSSSCKVVSQSRDALPVTGITIGPSTKFHPSSFRKVFGIVQMRLPENLVCDRSNAEYPLRFPCGKGGSCRLRCRCRLVLLLTVVFIPCWPGFWGGCC
jgi:hypothetical protein